LNVTLSCLQPLKNKLGRYGFISPKSPFAVVDSCVRPQLEVLYIQPAVTSALCLLGILRAYPLLLLLSARLVFSHTDSVDQVIRYLRLIFIPRETVLCAYACPLTFLVRRSSMAPSYLELLTALYSPMLTVFLSVCVGPERIVSSPDPPASQTQVSRFMHYGRLLSRHTRPRALCGMTHASCDVDFATLMCAPMFRSPG